MIAAIYARNMTVVRDGHEGLDGDRGRHSSRVYLHIPGMVLCSERSRAVADNVFALAEINAPRRFMLSQWLMISELG